jgi:ornithine decarboxylase antizyme
MALITLAENLDCAQLVIAIAREMTADQSSSLIKGLGWAGFSPTTLDFWTNGGVDVTSDKWLFMGLEV